MEIERATAIELKPTDTVVIECTAVVNQIQADAIRCAIKRDLGHQGNVVILTGGMTLKAVRHAEQAAEVSPAVDEGQQTKRSKPKD